MRKKSWDIEIFHPFSRIFIHFLIWFLIANFDTVSWHKASVLVNCANFEEICIVKTTQKKLYSEKFFHKTQKHGKWEITTKILTCALNTCDTNETR